ncbi:MAG: ATP-binding protein [Candidatus Cloacimonas sp.]|jgi:signal transduction histidine kinase/CheY-like chemotaxis protein|nr:response regulator [Candidatus Cloacimonadota bacterium]
MDNQSTIKNGSVWCKTCPIFENGDTISAKTALTGDLPLAKVFDSRLTLILLEHLKDIVLLVNKGGMLLYLNSSAKDLLQVQEVSVIGEYLSDLLTLINPRTNEIVTDQSYFDKLFVENIEPKQYNELLYFDANRRRRQVSLKIIPIKEDDTLTGAMYIITDQTVYHLMEDQLLKVQQLQSQREFIGGIAHDFNNILTSIMGNISLAQLQSDKPENVKTRLTAAEKNCEKAQNLSLQLMNYSKEGIPNKKCGSILEIAEETARFVSHGSNVNVEFNFAKDVSPLEFDAVQISQVINNLVLNATQAMPSGGTVTISCCNFKVTKNDQLPITPGDYVNIRIADNGIGIAADYLNRIFEPFFTTKETGYGIGLASCRKIINNHNGHISVSSQLGEGTEFNIFLPVSSLSRCEVEESSEQKDYNGDGKVLLLDDDPEVRKIFEKMLILFGYEVEHASNEKEALALFRESVSSSDKYKFVIVDLTLKGGASGYDTFKKLRAVDNNVKAILTTGYLNNPMLKDYRELGFVGYLAKPFRLQELILLLSNIRD